MDEDLVTDVAQSCPSDGVGCSSHAATNPFMSQAYSASLEQAASDGGNSRERACDSLIMCIVTTLNQGLRNGGGIGDILRAPSSKVRMNFLTIFL